MRNGVLDCFNFCRIQKNPNTTLRILEQFRARLH